MRNDVGGGENMSIMGSSSLLPDEACKSDLPSCFFFLRTGTAAPKVSRRVVLVTTGGAKAAL